jgi:hypothetical protein
MKLSRIKVGDEITCAFLNRLVDKANENELKPMAPLFKKATTNGTQLGIAGFPSVTPEVLQYGVIVSGWTLDNPINYTWVIPTDAAGAWRKGYSGGSGYGAWVSGSGITKVYLENPGAAVYPYSGYSNDTFAGNWNWLMQSGVVITYFPLNSGNFSGQYDPDTLEWVTEGIDIGWAMPTQKLPTWGELTDDWVSGNNFVYINPVSLPDGGAPYPYTGDPIKCYLTTPINSIPSFPSGSGLVSGDVLSIISWVSYASGDVLVPECFAGPTISAGGAGGTTHPLLDGHVNNDTFPNSPEPGAFIVGADTASGLKWDIFPALSAPSILSLSGTDTVAWMDAGDDGEIPYVNSSTEMDWLPAPGADEWLGETAGIPTWKTFPPPPNPLPNGDLNEVLWWNTASVWTGAGSTNSILICRNGATASVDWLSGPTVNPGFLVYDNNTGSTPIMHWTNIAWPTGGFPYNSGNNIRYTPGPTVNPGFLVYDNNTGSTPIMHWTNIAWPTGGFPYNSGNNIIYTPTPLGDNQILFSNGGGYTFTDTPGPAPFIPAVLVFDDNYGSTASTHWTTTSGGEGSIFFTFATGGGVAAGWSDIPGGDYNIPYFKDHNYEFVPAPSSGQILMGTGNGFIWSSGVHQQVVTDVYWDTNSGVLVKTYANIFVLSTDSGSGNYITANGGGNATHYNTTSLGSGYLIDLALYCSGA